MASRRIVAAMVVLTAMFPPSGSAQGPPRSIAWEQTAGPRGGVVTRLVASGDRVWASLYSGGIYERRGAAWSQIAIGAGIPENRAQDIVIDPTDPARAYVPQVIACAARTADGGATWEPLCDPILEAAGAPNFSAHTMGIDPSDPARLFLPGETHDGRRLLLVSPDRGQSWSVHATFEEPAVFNHMIWSGTRMLLGTREHGVLTSIDGGASWTAFGDGLREAGTIRFAASGGTIWLAAGTLRFNVREGGTLYRLEGTSWVPVPGPRRVTGLHAGGGALWAGGEGGALWRSTDGATFVRLGAEGLPAEFVGEIVVAGDAISAGVGGRGIWRSTDGGATFAADDAGLTSIATREVHVHPRDPDRLVVVTWDRPGLYRSSDGGQTYRISGGSRMILTAAPRPGAFARVYAAGDRFHEVRFDRSPPAWTRRTRPGPPGSFVKAIAVHPDEPARVLAGVAAEVAESPSGFGLWRSVDRGETWRRAEGIGDRAVHSIVYHPRRPAVVYAAALGGGVYRSDDGGRSFARIGGTRLRYTYRLTMSPSDPQHLIAGSNLFFAGLSGADQISGAYGGLFESRDGGRTWREMTAGIRDYDGSSDPQGFRGWLYNFGHLPNYEQVVIDPSDPSHVVVGHHGESVVSTIDGGDTWEKRSTGMIPGSMHNYAYCLAWSGGRLYACTCGRGLFAGTLVADEPASSSASAPATPAEARAAFLTAPPRHGHLPQRDRPA